MKKIVIKDDFAFLYLNKQFYSKTIIIKTIQIYKEFFKANIEETKKYNIIKIEKLNNEFSLQILSNEFLNYLISSYPRNEAEF